MLSEPILVVVRVVQAFDELAIEYVVGGSLASSVYGVPRATQDVDLVADLALSHADLLKGLLGDEFYVDADMIRDAVRRRGSFNVIHLATMFKADVFLMRHDDWSQEEMKRARLEELNGPEGAVTVRFASPEDTLLHKLLWYRLGDEVSDRQWSDILGVLKIQGGHTRRVRVSTYRQGSRIGGRSNSINGWDFDTWSRLIRTTDWSVVRNDQ